MAKPKLWRGLMVLGGFAIAASVTAATLMEYYRDPLDQLLGTQSVKTTYETIEDGENHEDPWNFKSNFKTAKEAHDGFKEFALKEGDEAFALLKNKNEALPISKTQKITLLGLRSYAAIYGNTGGSIADKVTVEDGNRIYEAFKDEGFEINPSMLATYKAYCDTLTWGGKGFGAVPPGYSELNVADRVEELSKSELSAINPEYEKDFGTYDTAVVVLGRIGGESVAYTKSEQPTATGTIMGISDEEKEILSLAKEKFKKVIVLINSTQVMEFSELKNDDGIDAIMWIGYPGAYGFHGVARNLNGTVNPSAHLGDFFPTNGLTAPGMQSMGNVPWANASDFDKAANVNGYLVEAEGIYTGYRYYESRYADIVNGVTGASNAKAGTYTDGTGKLAKVDGTWNYLNETNYPFGHGLSYTTFTQTLDSVSIKGDKRTAEVKVTVKNTGSRAGKSVVQLYAQAPYTEYDKEHGVERSAIQLMDFEKTKLLEPNESQTITMNVDMENLAAYDNDTAKTFIVEGGKHYFAIGDDSHDALNNILAKQGKTTAHGMTANGDASKVYEWDWGGGVDAKTFSVSETGTEITNHLSDGIYSMDLNTFMPGTVTYLTRKDWNGTFPKEYAGLEAKNADLVKALGNDIITLKTNDDTSAYKWGVKNDLQLKDMKGAKWDDERWETLIDEVSITEFLDFASHAFHHIQEIPSVGYAGNDADDGPGGSDTHYFENGFYQGVQYSEADSTPYKGMGSRVAPAQQNLAYTWNKELAYENGQIILGESSLVFNLPIMIGPGANLHRHGYNGRGGEYYSEDPILSGYIGSASVQGAQELGCIINIKHAAFNDQEINRSGVAVFMEEQKARELELRNLKQLFVGGGKPASFVADETKSETYTEGALGVMTSYNRIGAVASSANRGVMVDIMRNEWGFKGYNVTDFTGVSLKAAPKESIMAGTTAFCGFGSPSLDYWSEGVLSKDAEMCAAIKEDIKYVLYPLANSNALNGLNSNVIIHREEVNTSWRIGYKSAIGVSSTLTAAFAVGAIIDLVKKLKGAK